MVIKSIRILEQKEGKLADKLPTGLVLDTDAPIVTLVGENGAGKSALLRMISTSLDTARGYAVREELVAYAKTHPFLGYLHGIEDPATDSTLERENPKLVERLLFQKKYYPDKYAESTRELANAYMDSSEQSRLEKLLREEPCTHFTSDSPDLEDRHTLGETALLETEYLDINNIATIRTANVEKIRALRRKILALAPKKTEKAKWGNCVVDVESLPNTYVAHYAPSNPFARFEDEDAYKQSQRDEYYVFQKERGNSSGQQTQTEWAALYKKIVDFFEEGVCFEFSRPQRIQKKHWNSRGGDPIPPKLTKEQQASARLVVLMDEPTTSVDMLSRRRLVLEMQEVAQKYQGRLQFIVATHDENFLVPQSKCVNFYKTPVASVPCESILEMLHERKT